MDIGRFAKSLIWWGCELSIFRCLAHNGHVHDSFDYVVGKCRVVANPRGYARNRLYAESPSQLEWENPAFDPQLVVEV
jgi:hypothetical protein